MSEIPTSPTTDLNPPEGWQVGMPGENGFYVPAERVEQEAAEHERVRAAIGRLSVDHAANIVSSFHGAERHYFGVPIDNKSVVNSIITTKGEDGRTTNELLAQGEDAAEAMYKTWLGMRELETVKTKPLTQLEIHKGVGVDFTKLEHYAPKIAPSLEAYKLPEHLKPLIEGNGRSQETYENTVAEQGWDKQLFSFVGNYLQTPKGSELAKGLSITSLKTLTPEQAVKLSLSVVQDMSKYSKDAAGNADGDAADKATALQLLQEGLANKDVNPTWRGNGVCRNIASNVHAVFDALKANQGELSMLRNTYCAQSGGAAGEGYDDSRENTVGKNGISLGTIVGHAWNTFTTIDGTGSANVTIADVTWALESTREAAIEEMDYTSTRMARTARALYEKSDDIPANFTDMHDYYAKFVGEGIAQFATVAETSKMLRFVMTEYLAAANTAIGAIDKGDSGHTTEALPPVPFHIVAAAKRERGKLDPSEITTLFRMSGGGQIEQSDFDTILAGYVEGRASDTIDPAGALSFRNTALQKAVLEKLPANTIRKLADGDAHFRASAREFAPGVLPPFDPEKNFSDAQELGVVARNGGLNVHSSSLKGIVTTLNRGLLGAAGGNQELVDRATQGHDLYDQVKNYGQLTKVLAEQAKTFKGLKGVLAEAAQLGLTDSDMRRLAGMSMNQRGVMMQRSALNAIIQRDGLPVKPTELLQLTREYQKEVVRTTEKGPLYHYHQTNLSNLEGIVTSGGLLSYNEQKRRGSDRTDSGSRPDVVQMTRDKYDKDGIVVQAGLPATSQGLGAAGDIAFIFEPSIMDNPDYDSLSTYPNTPDALFDKLHAVAVSNPDNIPYVKEQFAKRGVNVSVISRADWSSRYGQTAKSGY